MVNKYVPADLVIRLKEPCGWPVGESGAFWALSLFVVAAPTAGMGQGIDLRKTGNAVVGIDLRGLQRTMAQQLLNFTHIGTAIHQVGGEGVAKDVGAAFALHTRLAKHPPNKPIDGRARNSGTFLG